jgi:hypothetical protein
VGCGPVWWGEVRRGMGPYGHERRPSGRLFVVTLVGALARRKHVENGNIGENKLN